MKTSEIREHFEGVLRSIDKKHADLLTESQYLEVQRDDLKKQKDALDTRERQLINRENALSQTRNIASERGAKIKVLEEQTAALEKRRLEALKEKNIAVEAKTNMEATVTQLIEDKKLLSGKLRMSEQKVGELTSQVQELECQVSDPSLYANITPKPSVPVSETSKEESPR